MARPRNPARDESKRRWLESGGQAELKTIAEALGVSPGQVRKWKSTDKWSDDLNGNVTKAKKERYQTLTANGNAAGNSGNRHASPPKGNKNAVTHGLFANWLPDETNQIIESMADRSPADLIWDQIQIQYAAIIRAQKIMYVSDSGDYGKKLSGYTEGAMSQGETYAVEFAWDKQAGFMAAQSRAMGTLLNLIKQFVAMCPSDDERKNKADTIKQALKKAKADARQAEATADMTEIERDKMKGVGYKNPLLEAIAKGAEALLPQEADNADKSD